MGLDLLGGVLVSAPVALLAWRARALTFGGAAAGFFCAVAIYLAGAFVESALATRFESRGVLDNNALNVLNTACAAALAVWEAADRQLI